MEVDLSYPIQIPQAGDFKSLLTALEELSSNQWMQDLLLPPLLGLAREHGSREVELGQFALALDAARGAVAARCDTLPARISFERITWPTLLQAIVEMLVPNPEVQQAATSTVASLINEPKPIPTAPDKRTL